MMRTFSFVLVALATYGSAIPLDARVPKGVTTSIGTSTSTPPGTGTVTFDPPTAFPIGTSTSTPPGTGTVTFDPPTAVKASTVTTNHPTTTPGGVATCKVSS